MICFSPLIHPATSAYIRLTHYLLLFSLQILPALCVLIYHTDMNVSICIDQAMSQPIYIF